MAFRPLTAVALALAVTTAARAQEASAGNRLLATRAELQSIVASGKASGSELEIIRRRLAEGDFHVDDRIVVRVLGEPTLSDSFQVKAGPALELPNLDKLPLGGVLRSELEERVRTHVAKYLKQPEVTAYSVVRLGITGAVGRPGFYSVPANIDITQAVMMAGGFATDGDIKKITISRNGALLYGPKEASVAFAAGRSPDLLSLESGDAIEIGRRAAPGGFGRTVGILTGIAGLALTIVLVARR